jgi:hypothetical protein
MFVKTLKNVSDGTYAEFSSVAFVCLVRFVVIASFVVSMSAVSCFSVSYFLFVEIEVLV